jgi:hypothetical protein
MNFKPPPSVGLGNLGTSWNLGDHKIRDALGGLRMLFSAVDSGMRINFGGSTGLHGGDAKGGCNT